MNDYAGALVCMTLIICVTIYKIYKLKIESQNQEKK